MENKVSRKKTARLAGLLYFIWFLTGMYAMFYIPSHINTEGDAVTASRDILANEFLFRTSIINGIFSSIIWIFMVLVFYRLFKSVCDRQAKLLVAFVIVQVPTVFFMEAFSITSLMIFKGKILKSFDLIQRNDVAMLFLNINEYLVLTLEVFWGMWLFPLGILIYKSRFLPRFLGVWLFINGFAFLVLSYIGLMLPQFKHIAFKIALPAMLGEVALMLWLLIMGAKNKIQTVPSDTTNIPVIIPK